MQETDALLCNMEANSKQQEAAKAQSATAKEKGKAERKEKETNETNRRRHAKIVG